MFFRRNSSGTNQGRAGGFFRPWGVVMSAGEMDWCRYRRKQHDASTKAVANSPETGVAITGLALSLQTLRTRHLEVAREF